MTHRPWVLESVKDDAQTSTAMVKLISHVVMLHRHQEQREIHVSTKITHRLWVKNDTKLWFMKDLFKLSYLYKLKIISILTDSTKINLFILFRFIFLLQKMQVLDSEFSKMQS